MAPRTKEYPNSFVLTRALFVLDLEEGWKGFSGSPREPVTLRPGPNATGSQRPGNIWEALPTLFPVEYEQ